MKNNLTIYLATSITGKKTEDVETYFILTEKKLIDMGYNAIHCYQAKNGIKPNTIMTSDPLYHDPSITDNAILYRDNWMVRQCDILFANLLNAPRISIGTICEIAWAWDHHKHIVLAIEDKSIHDHAFLRSMVPIHYSSYDQCINYLNELVI